MSKQQTISSSMPDIPSGLAGSAKLMYKRDGLHCPHALHSTRHSKMLNHCLKGTWLTAATPAQLLYTLADDVSNRVQEAHVTQGRLVRNLEARVCEVGQTIQTVKSQEKVIAKLEGWLKQAAQERRAAVATVEQLQQQLARLENQLEISNAQVSIVTPASAHLYGVT